MSVHVLYLAQVSTFFPSFAMRHATSSCQADIHSPRPGTPPLATVVATTARHQHTHTHTHTYSRACVNFMSKAKTTTKLQSLARSFLGSGQQPRPPSHPHSSRQLQRLSDCLQEGGGRVTGAGAAAAEGRGSFRLNLCASRSP